MPPWRPGSTLPFAAKNKIPLSANSPLLNCAPKWQVRRVEQRPEARRPERIVGTVPAVPAVEARVEHAGRVAVDFLQPEAARAPVLPFAIGNVAGGAENRAVARQPRLEEQLLAERN